MSDCSVKQQPSNTQPQTGPISPEFVPSLCRPDDLNFTLLLDQLKRSGFPFVGAGRGWGAFPRIRSPASNAPTPESLDRDLADVGKERWFWEQPAYHDLTREQNGVTGENRDQVIAAKNLWDESKPRWQPARHATMCMWASSARHIRLRDDQEIGDELLELAGDDGSGALRERRFRSLPGTISRGDECWAALGAWPWAAVDEGHLPNEWWTGERARTELADAVLEYADEQARRAGVARAVLKRL
jgi:hypothetical protein